MITTKAATLQITNLKGLKEMAGPFVGLMQFVTIAEMDWPINYNSEVGLETCT